VTLVSATQIAATLTVGANAVPGPGASTPFTVVPPPPTLTSIEPSHFFVGASVPVTLTGTNFASGATVGTDEWRIGVTNVVVVSATQITALFTIPTQVVARSVDLYVRTIGGITDAVSFRVEYPPPTLTSSRPPASRATGCPWCSPAPTSSTAARL
jgi:hypothetical protein